MTHTCTNAVVHCIDFRLQKTIVAYLEENKILGDGDMISIAGGVQNADFILNQITLSKKLHGIKRVILINHTDCGAYGGSAAFTSLDEEKAAHTVELQKMRERLGTPFPDLDITTLLAEIAPDSHEVRIVPV